MAVPSSGVLHLTKLANEKHFDNYNQAQLPAPPYSLKDITVGGQSSKLQGVSYDVTNTDSDQFPNNSKPYAMSEFYGYDHDASPAQFLKHIGNQMESFTTSHLGTSNSQMSGNSYGVSGFADFQHTYVQVEMLDNTFDQLRFNITVSGGFGLVGLYSGGQSLKGEFPESPNSKDGWKLETTFDEGSHSYVLGGSAGKIVYITLYGFGKTPTSFSISNMYCEPKSS